MKPGIYTEISAANYFADCCPAPSLTQSLCKVLLERSPKHAWLRSPKLNPAYRHDEAEYSKSLAIGNAAHRLLLGRGKDLTIIEADDFRGKAAREARDAALALGRVPILGKHAETASRMVEAAREQLAPLGLAGIGNPDRGSAEAVLVWNEGDTWFRSMVDWLADGNRTVIDYKTSAMCCSPHAIAQKMVSDGFDVQAAFHSRGLDVIDPSNAGRRRHLFACQENTEPFALTVVQLSEAVMHIGRRKVEYAVALWQRCMALDEWPMYPARIVVPEMPQYAETRWLERETQQEIVNILAAG